jgi:hypothetical protein
MSTTNNTPKTVRTYGNERTFGDILYSPKTQSVFCNIELGFFGRTTVTLQKRDDDTYDLLKSYIDKQGQEQVIKLGQTFPVTKADGTPVEGMTKATLGLFKRYDKVIGKEVTDNSDALFITTHKLKEPKPLGNSGLMKVGFITGQFGIEVSSETAANPIPVVHEEIADIPADKIPF